MSDAGESGSTAEDRSCNRCKEHRYAESGNGRELMRKMRSLRKMLGTGSRKIKRSKSKADHQRKRYTAGSIKKQKLIYQKKGSSEAASFKLPSSCPASVHKISKNEDNDYCSSSRTHVRLGA